MGDDRTTERADTAGIGEAASLQPEAISKGTPAGEVVLYVAPDGTVTLDVRLERENIWLTQKQMSELFGTERSVITKHLNNVFASGELEREGNVQKMHIAGADRPVAFYALDAIISIGYRVNSKRGTQFRIWATGVIRDHIVRGYTLNQKRLRDLNQTVRLIADTSVRVDLGGDEAQALLAIVGEYNRAFGLLDDYDHQRITKPTSVREVRYVLTHSDALQVVGRLRSRFGGSGLFGVERGEALRGALNAVVQTFGSQDLYPSLEEKAANLLYFLVKDHPFVDGNKRIAAALFLWFLERNGVLAGPDAIPRVSDAALVALTLMMAESRPEEKDVLVHIVMHLLIGTEGDR